MKYRERGREERRVWQKKVTGLGLAASNGIRVITAGSCGDVAALAPEPDYEGLHSTATPRNPATMF